MRKKAKKRALPPPEIREKSNPEVREVKAHDGIKRTTTCHYFCENCYFEKKVPHTETIPYENN